MDSRRLHLCLNRPRPEGSGIDSRPLSSEVTAACSVLGPNEKTAWAWLAGRRLDLAQVRATVDAVPLLGSPSHWEPMDKAINGWPSATARPVRPWRSPSRLWPLRRCQRLASILEDDLLVSSLRQFYLEPLSNGRDGGEAAKATLRSYFASGRNVSSAAAALGVSRKTIASRMRVIEGRLGRTIDDCATDVEVAIRLEDERIAPW